MLITGVTIFDMVDLRGVPTWLALKRSNQLRFKICDTEYRD